MENNNQMNDQAYNDQAGYNTNYNAQYSMNNSNTSDAPTFFMQFPFSFNPKKYGELIKITNGKMVGFVFLLLAICTLVSYISFAIAFRSTKQWNAVLDMFPDFSLSNGKFLIAEEYKYDNKAEKIYVCATDDKDRFEITDADDLHKEDGYDSIILLSKNNIVLYNNGEYNELTFTDLPPISINKNWILNTFMPLLFAISTGGFVIYYVLRVGWYFFCALIYALLGMLCAKIFNRNFSFGVLYKSSIYAKVIMTIVACLLGVLPVSISIPFALRTIATLSLIVVSFTSLPENIYG